VKTKVKRSKMRTIVLNVDSHGTVRDFVRLANAVEHAAANGLPAPDDAGELPERRRAARVAIGLERRVAVEGRIVAVDAAGAVHLHDGTPEARKRPPYAVRGFRGLTFRGHGQCGLKTPPDRVVKWRERA
jgi:hypothetical protein